MANITTRAGKGSPLTHAEVDGNFTALNGALANVFTIVPNVLSIPSTPVNGDRIEISDSTNIQTLLTIQGIPTGFVGSSDLAVRLQYASSAGKWLWQNYISRAPDSRYGAFVRMTEQPTTGGTAKAFTGIPVGVKRVTVIFNGVSDGNAKILVQLGVGTTPTTSGYVNAWSWLATNFANYQSIENVYGVFSTAGIPVYMQNGGSVIHGQLVFTNISENTWVAYGGGSLITSAGSDVSGTVTSAGAVTLSGSLGMVNITWDVAGAAFDAGSVNVLYE